MRNLLSRTVQLCLAAGLLQLTSVSAHAAQQTDDGEWHVAGEIFLWGAGIDGETKVGEIGVDFDEILSSLEMTFMGKLAATKGNGLLFAEVIYLDLKNDKNISDAPAINADLKLKSFVSTFGGGYRLMNTEKAALHATAGARYLYLDSDLSLTGDVAGKSSVSGSNWDGVVGLRGEYGFTDNWVLTYYGDMGAGDSDFTWHALAAVNYRWTRWAVAVGYSHLEWDLDSKSAIQDLTISGPYIGGQFKFR